MVPMILMSLLPMLGIGGMFGAQTINSDTIMMITLVAIPAGILVLSLNGILLDQDIDFVQE